MNLKEDLIVGAKAAAEYTGLGRRQIYHMIEGGQLPAIRMGRRVMFRKSELDNAFRAAA